MNVYQIILDLYQIILNYIKPILKLYQIILNYLKSISTWLTQIWGHSKRIIELSYSKGNAAVADLDLGANPTWGVPSRLCEESQSNHVLTLGPQWKTNGKTMENHGKSVLKFWGPQNCHVSWEDQWKTNGKKTWKKQWFWWENPWKSHGKPVETNGVGVYPNFIQFWETGWLPD